MRAQSIRRVRPRYPDSMRMMDADAFAAATPWPALCDALRRGLGGAVVSPARTLLDPTGQGDALLLMPAWREAGLMGVKLVTVYPRESPALDGVFVAFDQATGKVRALIDGMALTNRRTAAAAALASSILARKDSRVMLMIGTGALAGPIIEAHRAMLPIHHVLLWGRNAGRAGTLAEVVGAEPVQDLRAALAQADIVACATTATTPIIPAEAVRAGQHLCLVGAFTPAMAEADPAIMPRARVYADDRASVLAKGGEVFFAIRSGLISESDVLGDLASICAVPPSREAAAITVYKSVGFAALDLIAAELALSRCAT
jgi:ornithine cyclodeaminase/alanine dehydrogenase-like protein (mu-crystallin family)